MSKDYWLGWILPLLLGCALGYFVSQRPANVEGEGSARETIGASAMLGGMAGILMLLSAMINPVPRSAQEAAENQSAMWRGLLHVPFWLTVGTVVGIALWLWQQTGARTTPAALQPYAGAIVGGLGVVALAGTVRLIVAIWVERKVSPAGRKAKKARAAATDQDRKSQTASDEKAALSDLRDEVTARRFLAIMNANPRFQALTAEEKVYLIRWSAQHNDLVSRGAKIGLMTGLAEMISANQGAGFTALKAILGVTNPKITTPAQLLDLDDKFTYHGSMFADKYGLSLAARLAERPEP